MYVSEAKAFVGLTCEIEWTDRHGTSYQETARIDDVAYVPMYGACLLTTSGEIRLERVSSIQPSNERVA